MSTPPPDPEWECTLHYILLEKIQSKNVINGSDIKLVKDANGLIKGFSVTVNSKNPEKAETIGKKKVTNLERILTTKSGMAVCAIKFGVY